MALSTSKTTLSTFVTLCLQRAAKDTIQFFKLNDFVSWVKLLVPPILTFLALWFLWGPESVSKQMPTWVAVVLASFGWALIIFVIHLGLAPYKLFADSTIRASELQSKVNEFQEAQVPRLAIEFYSQDTYVQEVGSHVLFRISVRNLSAATTVESISVDLTNIKPYRPPLLPMRLHIMHDNPADRTHQQTFDLNPGDRRFIDVLEVYRTDAVHYAIRHIVRDVTPNIVDKLEVLTIAVTAKNCPTVSADFQLLDRNGIFRFSKLQ